LFGDPDLAEATFAQPLQELVAADRIARLLGGKLLLVKDVCILGAEGLF
jgi:hypothetical protein